MKEKIGIFFMSTLITLSIIKVCSLEGMEVGQIITRAGSSCVLIIIAGGWFGVPVRIFYMLFKYRPYRLIFSIIMVIWIIAGCLGCLGVFGTSEMKEVYDYYIMHCCTYGIYIGMMIARWSAYRNLAESQ